jgi:hypothetical protein
MLVIFGSQASSEPPRKSSPAPATADQPQADARTTRAAALWKAGTEVASDAANSFDEGA